jgi:small subunit ribosomal protein S3
MIERKVVQQKLKEYLIEDYISSMLRRVGYSHTTVSRNPLGEKITIYASRPGLIVGSKGANIKKLTKVLKAKFKLENPQVEIEEVREVNLDPKLVAESICSGMERFGTARFKGIGYKAIESTMRAGALGIEVIISGKLPSSRAKSWRFYAGYLKKSGDVAASQVKSAYDIAMLKTGIVGVQVRIMPPDLMLPDKIILRELDTTIKIEETNEVVETENLKNIKKRVRSKKNDDSASTEKRPRKAKKAEGSVEKKEIAENKDSKIDITKTEVPIESSVAEKTESVVAEKTEEQ